MEGPVPPQLKATVGCGDRGSGTVLRETGGFASQSQPASVSLQACFSILEDSKLAGRSGLDHKSGDLDGAQLRVNSSWASGLQPGLLPSGGGVWGLSRVPSTAPACSGWKPTPSTWREQTP